jgi:predicted ATP-dependent serine protease
MTRRRSFPPIRTLYEELPDLKLDRMRVIFRRQTSLRTELKSFDDALGGLPRLMVLGGPPGVGKSALALQLAHNIAENGKAIVVYQSAEMRKEDLLNRIRGTRDGSEHGPFAWLEMHGRLLAIEPSHALTPVDQLPARLDALRERSGRRQCVVIVDSLQELAARFGTRNKDAKDTIDSYLRKFREMVDGSPTYVLVVSHYTKQGAEQSRYFPFSGSSTISYVPDVTAALQGHGAGRTLQVLKNRHGLARPISLRFDARTLLFSDLPRGRKCRP